MQEDFYVRIMSASIHLGEILSEIEEDDDGGIANRGVMAGELKTARLAIHLEDGDVVASLIATIQKLARGIKVEAAWIIPPGPFFPEVGEVAVLAHGKNRDAVVQPVACIDKLPIV